MRIIFKYPVQYAAAQMLQTVLGGRCEILMQTEPPNHPIQPEAGDHLLTFDEVEVERQHDGICYWVANRHSIELRAGTPCLPFTEHNLMQYLEAPNIKGMYEFENSSRVSIVRAGDVMVSVHFDLSVVFQNLSPIFLVGSPAVGDSLRLTISGKKMLPLAPLSENDANRLQHAINCYSAQVALATQTGNGFPEYDAATEAEINRLLELTAWVYY